MTGVSDPSYRVTLRDVDGKVDALAKELAEVRTLISERLPDKIDERLRAVELSIPALEQRVKTLEEARPPRAGGWAIAGVVLAAVAIVVSAIVAIVRP